MLRTEYRCIFIVYCLQSLQIQIFEFVVLHKKQNKYIQTKIETKNNHGKRRDNILFDIYPQGTKLKGAFS